MCLLPMGGSGMNMNPQFPPSDRAKFYQKVLYGLMAAHGALALMIMFTGDLMTGIFELILVLILWCAAKPMQYCQVLFYIFFCLYSWI